MSELLDRLRIAELYARYNWAMDNSDAEAFARTFCEDGAFVGTMGAFEGRDELEAFARKQDLKSRGLQHWNANMVLRFEGDGAVHGKTYMLVVCAGAPCPTIERAGFYADLLVRDGDDWLFKTRRFTPLTSGG